MKAELEGSTHDSGNVVGRLLFSGLITQKAGGGSGARRAGSAELRNGFCCKTRRGFFGGHKLRLNAALGEASVRPMRVRYVAFNLLTTRWLK